MNGLERTRAFIAGRAVERPPFHPILMRLAARHTGTPYGAFCREAAAKCPSMLRCAADFGLDWVTTLSDPYCEAEAFGLEVDYPENELPRDRGPLLRAPAEMDGLFMPVIADAPRMRNRVREVEEFRRQAGERLFIVGWVEGPLAEYADLRGLSDACLDLYDEPERMHRSLDFLLENACRFAAAQAEAGAHCVGIGDAVCSQIGPAFYREFCFAREKALVDEVHAHGALAKLHICGNTRELLPDMIRTGADIVDIDHLVGSMAEFVPLLGPGQVLSGNSDPVRDIRDGDRASIFQSVNDCHRQMQGRGIVSAGCEIPPDTSLENFQAYCDAAHALPPAP